MSGNPNNMQSESNVKHLLVQPEKIRLYCGCGRPHPGIGIRVQTGHDVFDALAADVRDVPSIQPVFVLCDENTHAAAGGAVIDCIKKNGIPHDTLVCPGNVNADLSVAEKIEEKCRGYGLLVAVGAGTINDLIKFAADRSGIPYWCVPTAPSMNGYTSAIAAIKKAGVKRTVPAKPPQHVYVHPEVIKQSPLRLRQAGYCDVMAKSVSDMDWKIESILFNGTYCPLPTRLVSETENQYRPWPEKIYAEDEETVKALLNGLLISGAAMSLAGSSAPASGGEHLVSHFLDMRETLTGRVPDLHGFQVALGILLSAGCYTHLSNLDRSDLSSSSKSIIQTDLNHIGTIWGEHAREVEKRFMLKTSRLAGLDTLLPRHWPEIRDICHQVGPPGYYADLIRKTGFPLTLKSVNLSEDEFKTAALSARTIRERITILDIAAHAGVLEAAARDTLAILQ